MKTYPKDSGTGNKIYTRQIRLEYCNKQMEDRRRVMKDHGAQGQEGNV